MTGMKKYWWILLVILVVSSLVVGWSYYMKKNKWKTDEGLVRRIQNLTPGEMWVRGREWNDKDLILSFWDEVSGDTGEMRIDFQKTVVVVGVVDNERGEIRQELLVSMASPYWEKAFCPEDFVTFELKGSTYVSKKSVAEFTSEDVEKITNFGPSRCRN